MDQIAQAQKEHLETLEEAAEESAQPEEIRRRAEQPSTRRSWSLAWILPYLAAAAVVAGAFGLIQWKPALVGDAMAVKVQRYLLGALAVIGLLATARGIEVLVIARVHNAVS